ncbi:hypothetical protein [Pseudoalteromonas maricaloris]|uniref:hypothetical protein n=1 Tax=Pseudoalteromonas maricaloris TaxID=184924 RepID=UPI00057CF912|nr:hypothetical protein [Pseudoalteromonas flavipulchra]KID33372.1 hypothetical protein QT15_23395 [Pseudoalteromonas flavipulchra NCIMB 2033 = ATCC BAA-314]MBD0781909.1 hypothetical protein [Pseudoalteromonas flavipulchra]MBE0373056.1 hypothetical protein [Pseudoalteromonas flavipulchra NCIMB 2033 = ATCC BAA-314]
MVNFSFEESFCSEVDHIFIFNFLGEEGNGLIKRLEDDIVLLVNNKKEEILNSGSIMTKLDISSLAEFQRRSREVLNFISKNKVNSLFHLQGHGSKKDGIKCEDSNFVCWSTLKSFLADAVKAAQGELTVIAAACHSYTLVDKDSSIPKLLPYSFYYGYEKKIEFGHMENDLRTLYKNLLVKGGDIRDSELRLKLSSEFDNVSFITLPMTMQFYPEEARQLGLSNRFFLESVKLDTPASVNRNVVKSVLKDTRLLSIEITKDCFHATPRRERLISAINKFYDTNSAPVP